MNSAARELTVKALEGRMLTRMPGRPTMRAVNKTRNQITAEYAKAKTSHEAFPMGSRFGIAAAIMKTARYIRVHDNQCVTGDELDPNWIFVYPDRPATYDASITGQMLDATRRKKEEERKDAIMQFDTFEGYELAFKEKLEMAYDAAYFSTLRDDILGFTHLTVLDMLEHLENQCLKLTNRERQSKLKECELPWEPGEDVNTYFTKLDKLEEELDDEYGIEWPTSLKMMVALGAMYDSNTFDEREMMAWEEEPPADQTWVHMVSYFTSLWEMKQRYNSSTPRRHGFAESAANVNDAAPDATANEDIVVNLQHVAIAATADKEHLQQMSNAADDLLSVIKEQQTQMKEAQAQSKEQLAQIKKLIEQNGQLTAALTNAKRGQSSRTRQPKATIPKAGDGNDGLRTMPEGMCIICGKRHFKNQCFELEKNAHKRPEGWVSCIK